MTSKDRLTFRTKVRSIDEMLLTPVLRLKFKNKLAFIGFSHDLFTLAHISILLFLTSFFYSCTKSPEPINYGKDECEHCRMMITDKKYGAEIVTDKGKIFKFDSIECSIKFALENNAVGDINQSFLVTDYSKPEELIDAKTAFYVQNDNFRSPMGLNVSAFKSKPELEKFLNENSGTKFSWFEVIELVKQNSM